MDSYGLPKRQRGQKIAIAIASFFVAGIPYRYVFTSFYPGGRLAPILLNNLLGENEKHKGGLSTWVAEKIGLSAY